MLCLAHAGTQHFTLKFYFKMSAVITIAYNFGFVTHRPVCVCTVTVFSGFVLGTVANSCISKLTHFMTRVAQCAI